MKLDTFLVLILTIVKCTGYADISWWVVFMPWIVGFALYSVLKILEEML